MSWLKLLVKRRFDLKLIACDNEVNSEGSALQMVGFSPAFHIQKQKSSMARWERKLNLAKVELLKDLATATESVGIPDRLQLSPLWKDVHAQFHLPVDPNDCRITVLEPGETSTFRVHVENIEVSVTGKLLAGSMNLESLTDFQASVWLQFDTSLEISDNTIDGRLIVELEGGDGLTTATTMNGEALSITPLQRIKLREQLESAIFHELGWKINEAILASVKNILE